MEEDERNLNEGYHYESMILEENNEKIDKEVLLRRYLTAQNEQQSNEENLFFGGNRGRTVVELPEQNNLPIPEFQTVGIYTQCFPTLFPVALGDPSIPEN